MAAPAYPGQRAMLSPRGDAMVPVFRSQLLQIHNANSSTRSLICFCSCAAGMVTGTAGEGSAIVRRVGRRFKQIAFRPGARRYARTFATAVSCAFPSGKR
jgi:hypothetical protein